LPRCGAIPAPLRQQAKPLRNVRQAAAGGHSVRKAIAHSAGPALSEIAGNRARKFAEALRGFQGFLFFFFFFSRKRLSGLSAAPADIVPRRGLIVKNEK